VVGDIRDVAQAGEFKSGYTDYVPPSPAPPRVAKAQFGINKMLNAKTPPREVMNSRLTFTDFKSESNLYRHIRILTSTRRVPISILMPGR